MARKLGGPDWPKIAFWVSALTACFVLWVAVINLFLPAQAKNDVLLAVQGILTNAF
jgi:hypothetical protein